MLRGAAGGGDTSPMCGAVLNARKHRTTPLVKPRTSLCASHLSTHATPLAPRARDCTVSPRTLPAHHRPQASCVVRGHVPSSSTRAPSPSPATAPTAPAGVGRRRRPRPTPSPGTAAPPSARGGATSAGAHRDLPAVTATGDCGRRGGGGDGSARRGRGLDAPHLAAPRRHAAPSSPRAAPTAATGVLGRLESHATHRTAAAAPTAATAGRVAL